MALHCPKCDHEFEAPVATVRPRVPPVPFVFKTERPGRLLMYWWQHNLPYDLRILTLGLVAVIAWLGHLYLPEPEFYQEFMAPQEWYERDWFSLLKLALLLLVDILMLYITLPWLWNRRFVEWDGKKLRAWRAPMGGKLKEVPREEIQQLYVSPLGELRCIRTNGEHMWLGDGVLDGLRYVEQQMEDQMKVVDVPVEGEWPAALADAGIRKCPNCNFEIPPAEVSRQFVPLPAPSGVVKEEKEGELKLRWAWLGLETALLGGWVFVWMLLTTSLIVVFPDLIYQPGPAAVPHLLVGLLAGYAFSACVINRTFVVCDGKELRIRSGPLPWPNATKTLKRSEIDQIYVVQLKAKLTTFRLEAKTTDGKAVVLLNHERDGNLLRYVEQELEKCLHIANVAVPEEYGSTAPGSAVPG